MAPQYIDYHNEGTAVVRFKNVAEKTKFLEYHPDASVFIYLDKPLEQTDGYNITPDGYLCLTLEVVEPEKAEEILKHISDKRAEVHEKRANAKSYRPWAKYWGRKRQKSRARK